jgi:hypothetical protein
MDMVMEENPTAYSVWQKIDGFFNTNKDSRAELEAELHRLQQGDLSASAYCHRLKTIADALADCDQPIRDHQLVHQLIAGLNLRYHTLKTMMPALPQFPIFVHARTMLLAEEASQNKTKTPASTETAILVSNGGSSSGDQSGARPESGERPNSGNGDGRSGGRSFSGNGHVIVGNGSSSPILGTGTVLLNSPQARFLLSKVLHTPHLIKNLVSVRQFTKDDACVEFGPHGFTVKDLHSKREIIQ